MPSDSDDRVAGRAARLLKAGSRQGRDWRAAFATYGRPRVVGMAFLGFSSGLPFLLVFSTLSAWLAQAGVSKTTIGLFSWIGIAYSIKFFWAPVIDRLPLPGLTPVLGRRRAWMLVAQLGLAAGLLGMAATDPTTELTRLAWLGLLVAFSSATQDVSIDAWRIEAVEKALQGAMAAAYQFGYRIALLVAGAGAFFIAAAASWPTTYAVMAALVGIGVLTVLIIGEPETAPRERMAVWEPWAIAHLKKTRGGPAWWQAAYRWLVAAVACPFSDFFSRYGRQALLILAFVSVFRVTDITLGVMANPFYLDMHYTLDQIASVSKVFGVLMTLLGAALGGVLVVRYSIIRPLLAAAVLAAATNLAFAWLATQHRPGLVWLAATVSADNLSGGMAGSAFIAYLSSLTNTAYTATQYALFSSLMTLPGKFLGGFSGWVVDHYGYVWFFIGTAAAGLPAILFLLWIIRLNGWTPEPARFRGHREEQTP